MVETLKHANFTAAVRGRGARRRPPDPNPNPNPRTRTLWSDLCLDAVACEGCTRCHFFSLYVGGVRMAYTPTRVGIEIIRYILALRSKMLFVRLLSVIPETFQALATKERPKKNEKSAAFFCARSLLGRRFWPVNRIEEG